MPSKKQRAKAQAKAKAKHKEFLGLEPPKKEEVVKIMCFYKGTCFPVDLSFTVEKWAQMKENWDEGLAIGEANGVTARDYLEQLDKMELFFHERATRKGINRNTPGLPKKMSKNDGKEMEKEFEETLGIDFHTGMSVWFMDVYFLIKMGELQDDDMNGWTTINLNPKNSKVGQFGAVMSHEDIY